MTANEPTISSSPAPAACDLEKGDSQNTADVTLNDHPADDELDIEHVYVQNDPRKWSRRKKMFVLALVSIASTIAGFGANIYNPAISQVQSDLHTSSSVIALSLSVAIFVQGAFPIVWCTISEIIGRKIIYISSLALCVVGSVIAGLAKNAGLFIGMRCVQAAGAASAISIGAATLADIFEPHERGFYIGIYYCAPLIGVSMGPLIGGALTAGLGWRSTLYFTAIFTAVCTLSFLFFEDTFRKERSAVYVDAVRRRRKERERKALKEADQKGFGSSGTIVEKEDGKGKDVEVQADKAREERADNVGKEQVRSSSVSVRSNEVEETPRPEGATPAAVHNTEVARKEIQEVHLTLLDANTIGPMVLVLRRLNNVVILTASGVFYGFAFSIAYSCARILGSLYGYTPLIVGVVLLAFGIGSVLGSILGGRYSDYVFKQLKAKHGGKSEPEMRLLSARILMIFLPPSVACYGWVVEKHVNVAAVCVFLFLSGFFSISVYSSTLAYIVDSNVGRSSSAVALNTFSRGIFGLIAAEIVVPLQDSIGEGGLYSLWAGWLLISELLIMLVCWKGGKWRKRGEEKDARDAMENK